MVQYLGYPTLPQVNSVANIAGQITAVNDEETKPGHEAADACASGSLWRECIPTDGGLLVSSRNLRSAPLAFSTLASPPHLDSTRR
jgi:hypothetical protein